MTSQYITKDDRKKIAGKRTKSIIFLIPHYCTCRQFNIHFFLAYKTRDISLGIFLRGYLSISSVHNISIFSLIVFIQLLGCLAPSDTNITSLLPPLELEYPLFPNRRTTDQNILHHFVDSRMLCEIAQVQNNTQNLKFCTSFVRRIHFFRAVQQFEFIRWSRTMK